MSFENPPPPGKSYSPLIMTALLFFCIGFATAYAVFAIAGDRVPPDTKVAENESTEAEPGKVSTPSAKTTNNPADASAQETTPPEVEEEPSPGDLTGFWPAHHLVVGIPGTELDEATRAMLAEFRPGGILLREENLIDAAQTRNLTLAIREAYGLGTAIEARPFIFVEQEGGVHNPLKLEDAPSFATLGAQNEPGKVQQIARRYALTARARGINAILGPTMDLYLGEESEEWLKEQSFGGAPVAVTDNAIAFAQGLADGGVIAVGKHYPGLGLAKLSTARVYEIAAGNEEDLAKNLLPFAEAAQLGIPGLVAGHASVPGLDKQAPARPASLSPVMIQTVLRENRGYNEVVLADDISTHPATSGMAVETVVIQALLAGCDGVIVSTATPEDIRRVCEAILAEIDADGLPPQRLIESRSRMEKWQIQLSEWLPPEEGENEPVVEVEEIPAPAPAPAEATPPPPPAPLTPAPQPEGTEVKSHAVVVGDTLAAVAGRYGVRIADIQAWNALASEEIQVGQTLKIYVEPEPAAPVEQPEPAASEAASTPPEPTAEADGEFIIYQVKPGDMLRRVAEAHGSTEAEVIKVNGLARPDIIQVGQKLKIPVSKDEDDE